MKKIAIVTDSSVALTEQLTKELEVYITPLSIIYDEKEYLDQVEITRDDIVELLGAGTLLGTSQPNLGVIINILEEIKSKNYDYVFILSLSSALSGTYSAFQHAITEVGLENYSLIDTMTLAGPVQESIKVIRKMNEQNVEPKDIEDYLNNDFFKNTESYIYPFTLEQLKRSGRISKSAALLASMMKVKPLLKIENQGKNIDKFKTTRTEQKIIDEIIKDLKLHNVNSKEHIIYLPHLKRDDILDEVKSRLTNEMGPFDFVISDLPAALATHVGVGTFVLQWAKKA